jgi:single-stranded-DNA-specific exonuclease
MTSFSGKSWTPSSEKIESFTHLMEVLLTERGLRKPEEISRFLSPCLTHLHDPFQMHDMQRACERILQARAKKERVMILGDFDADGITSTVILTDALKRLGLPVSYRIPDRNQDSHGLKNYLIDEIAQKEVSVVISCDCGINDNKEVQYAREKYDLDVIITDHHTSDPGRYPDRAVAVLNPKKSDCDYPEKELSGAGVAFKLITALASLIYEKNPEKIADFLRPYLEISAIGLVADCVRLQGENRILVRYGLEGLKNSAWDGLQKLLKRNQINPQNINADTIGFCIAPRLNAASRMGDVLRAAQLFLGDRVQNFERLSYLERLNKERQIITEQYFQEAYPQFDPQKKYQIFLEKNWKPGILGLIGSRFVEKYDQPIIAAQIREDGFMAASCRAPEGYSMVEALQSCGEGFLSRWAGMPERRGFC